MTDSWTDERMDDLSNRVDDGFARTDRELRALRVDMQNEFKAVRAEMRDGFGSVRGEIGSLRGEIAALNRTIILGFAGIAASLLGAVAVHLL